MSDIAFARLRDAALAGDLAQAAHGLEQLDARWPRPDVAALRAWVALAQDDLHGAARWLDTTFARDPDHREALTLATELARRQGDGMAALRHARRLAALEPRSAPAQYNLGVLLQAHDPVAACAAYDAALVADSAFAVALQARGWLRFDAGRADAGEDFGALARIADAEAAGQVGLGAIALRDGDAAAALRAFARARALAPNDLVAVHGHADALERLGHEAEALSTRRVVVERSGGDPAARCQYAMALSRAGDTEAARREAEAAAGAGGGPLASWLAFQLLPVVYADDAELAHWRRHWQRGLQAFDAATTHIAPADAAAVLTALPSFYRHYLDDHLLADQRAAGVVVERLARTALQPPRHRARPRSHGRLRVGFASAHFDRHTVGRLFAGLVAGLDRSRFEVLAVHVGAGAAGRAAALALADGVLGPLHALPPWVEALQAADLDVLVWLDIGMDGTTQALSALRFAPLQAMLWGHPVTSGLSSIDLFIGAHGMAPDDADSRYSERFVALPGIGLSITPPDLPPAAAGDGAPRLLCAQGIHKLLPCHDAIFARVLGAVPEATLDLLPGAAEPLRRRLEARMRAAMSAAGVEFERRVRVHPRLSDDAFRARLGQADLVLDTFDWSGGWTSLQALAAGLPVLTCPGAGLRARHTLAFVAALGLAPALAASDADDYVARAVALAGDRAARAGLADTVRARVGSLFGDRAPVDALGELLWRECGR